MGQNISQNSRDGERRERKKRRQRGKTGLMKDMRVGTSSKLIILPLRKRLLTIPGPVHIDTT